MDWLLPAAYRYMAKAVIRLPYVKQQDSLHTCFLVVKLHSLKHVCITRPAIKNGWWGGSVLPRISGAGQEETISGTMKTILL